MFCLSIQIWEERVLLRISILITQQEVVYRLTRLLFDLNDVIYNRRVYNEEEDEIDKPYTLA